MHESGNFKRGTGSVFDKSGGTNPFGQTVPAGTPGAVKGRDGQWHASYGSLQEGFEAHYKRWGSHYRRGGTPDQILGSMVGAGYNSVDPNWRSKISGIRARNAGRAAATPAPAPAPAAAVPSNVSEPNTGQPLPSGRLPTEHEARINLNVNDTQVQFARASMRRGADREVREARWNSYSDIGAA
jgi:hypothetical protein